MAGVTHENPKGKRGHRMLSMDVHRVWCGGCWEVTLREGQQKAHVRGSGKPLLI